MTRILQFSLLIFLLGITTLQANGKKPKMLEGSLDPLKSVQKMNVQFVYEGMTIGRDNLSDADYITRKKEEMNKKEPGSGDRWAAAWVHDRTARYEPGFRNMFNKYSKIKLGDFPEEKYTFLFKSTNTEPGFNVVVARKPSLLSGEAWIVETAHPETVICKLQVTNAQGNVPDSDFDTGQRIRFAYVKAAYLLQRFIAHKID